MRFKVWHESESEVEAMTTDAVRLDVAAQELGTRYAGDYSIDLGDELVFHAREILAGGAEGKLHQVRMRVAMVVTACAPMPAARGAGGT